MVKDIIVNTKKNLKNNKIKNFREVVNAKNILVNFSSEMTNFDYEIKDFLKQKMYYHSEVINKTRKGGKIIKLLFDKINKKPLKFINKNILKNQTNERAVCDFIAGMTDRYAINLYNKLK